MRLGLRFAAGGAAALLLLCVAAPAAFSYLGQVPNQITVTGPAGTLHCNTDLTLTATVLDATGAPVDGQTVTWAFTAGQVTGDQIVTASTTTNAAGVTTTIVRLACTVGNRTVTATDAPASGSLVLGIVAAGLPLTSTDPSSTPMWAYGLAALGVLVACFMVGRRVLQSR
jgi:adhesin/invasin